MFISITDHYVTHFLLPLLSTHSANHQAAPLCPAVGQRLLSVAQIVDRLNSGSAASATEACVSLHLVLEQCNFFKTRLGRVLKCPSLVNVALDAGLIPPLVRLLAKGGLAGKWASVALSCSCTKPADQQRTEEDVPAKDARAAFLAAGGVEFLVEMLALPLRHPALEKLPSLNEAALAALLLLRDSAADLGVDRAFRVRCIDAGIVAPLLHYLDQDRERFGDAGRPKTSGIIIRLCRSLSPRTGHYEAEIPAIITGFVNGGIAPVLARRLRLPDR